MSPAQRPAARRTFRTLALCVLFALPLLVGFQPATAAVGPGSTYLALGDSLTTGAEAAGNNDGKPGYPNYLYTLIKGSSGLQFKLLGVDGETSTSMRAPGGQLDQALAVIAQERAAGRVVSPVTLDIGGNDMVAVLQGQTSIEGALSLFRTNYAAILDALVAALSQNGTLTGDLVVMTYYNPYPGLKGGPPLLPFTIDTDRDVPRFNAIILEEAAKRNIPVAPVFEAFQNPKQKLVFANLGKYNPFLPLTDPANQAALDYHPTEAGQQVIATRFARTAVYSIPSAYISVIMKE